MTGQYIQQEAICYQWFKQRLILSISEPSVSQRSQIKEDTVEPSVHAREFNLSIRPGMLTRPGVSRPRPKPQGQGQGQESQGQGQEPQGQGQGQKSQGHNQGQGQRSRLWLNSVVMACNYTLMQNSINPQQISKQSRTLPSFYYRSVL